MSQTLPSSAYRCSIRFLSPDEISKEGRVRESRMKNVASRKETTRAISLIRDQVPDHAPPTPEASDVVWHGCRLCGRARHSTAAGDDCRPCAPAAYPCRSGRPHTVARHSTALRLAAW